MSRPFGRPRRANSIGIIGGAIVIAVAIALLWFATSCHHNTLNSQCVQDGGHLSWSNGYKGHVTYFCLSPGGRILWIR